MKQAIRSSVALLIMVSASALAQGPGPAAGGNAAGSTPPAGEAASNRELPSATAAAESPFNSYTAGVVGYALGAGFLVSVLLIGGFLVLNLGLLSKRTEDRVGGRTP